MLYCLHPSRSDASEQQPHCSSWSPVRQAMVVQRPLMLTQPPVHLARQYPVRICPQRHQPKYVRSTNGTGSSFKRAPVGALHKGCAPCTAHVAVAVAAWLALNSWAAPAACALDLPSASRTFPVSGPSPSASVNQNNGDGKNIEGLLSDAIAYVNGMLTYGWICLAIQAGYVAVMALHRSV